MTVSLFFVLCRRVGAMLPPPVAGTWLHTAELCAPYGMNVGVLFI